MTYKPARSFNDKIETVKEICILLFNFHQADAEKIIKMVTAYFEGENNVT